MNSENKPVIILSVIFGILLAVVLCTLPGTGGSFPLAFWYKAGGSVILMFVIYRLFVKNIASNGKEKGIKITIIEFFIFLAAMILCSILGINPYDGLPKKYSR